MLLMSVNSSINALCAALEDENIHANGGICSACRSAKAGRAGIAPKLVDSERMQAPSAMCVIIHQSVDFGLIRHSRGSVKNKLSRIFIGVVDRGKLPITGKICRCDCLSGYSELLIPGTLSGCECLVVLGQNLFDQVKCVPCCIRETG